MASDEIILGLDLAGNVGVAWGRADAKKPHCTSWRIGGTAMAVSPQLKGVRFLRHFLDFLRLEKPTRIFIEAPMTPRVMAQIGTEADDALFLVGLAYLALVTAESRGIRAELVDSQKVRKQFIGQARSGKGRDKSGKVKTGEKCRLLGWPIKNLDEADACAVWSYGVGQCNPGIAHQIDPLFVYSDRAPASSSSPPPAPKPSRPAEPTVESVFGKRSEPQTVTRSSSKTLVGGRSIDDLKTGDVISYRSRRDGSGKA